MASFQDKIDVLKKPIVAGGNGYLVNYEKLNQAIQELREEIKSMEYEKQSTEWSAGYNEALFDVLSLIGEKK